LIQKTLQTETLGLYRRVIFEISISKTDKEDLDLEDDA